MHANNMETQREVFHLEDTPKYNGNIEGDLASKNTMKQQDIFMVFSKTRLNSLAVFRNSVEKPHNTCTTQLVSSIVFEVLILQEAPSKIVKKSLMIYQSDPTFCVRYNTNLFL